MKSLRLETICNFLSANDAIIDIGCDHAYVAIEMAKRGTSKILATDIHEAAIRSARKNIQKEHLEGKIETQVKDGLMNIDTKDYQTLVIAGMGTKTIEHILQDDTKLVSIQTIILQSNHDLFGLRQFMQQKGYSLQAEKVIWEDHHYYVIMKYQKGWQDISDEVLELGLFDPTNLSYYQFLKEKYTSLLNEIPQEKKEEILKYSRKLQALETYLKRFK